MGGGDTQGIRGGPTPKLKGYRFAGLRYMKGKGFHLLNSMKV